MVSGFVAHILSKLIEFAMSWIGKLAALDPKMGASFVCEIQVWSHYAQRARAARFISRFSGGGGRRKAMTKGLGLD